MEQQRVAIRQKTFIGARIIYGNRALTMDCVIRDLAPDGARLVFAERPSVGDHFELDVPKKGWRLQVEAVWRKGREIGIMFEDRSDKGMLSDAERLKELERSNAALRDKIESWSVSA